MSELNYEHLLEALNALSPTACELRMRAPGDWFLSFDIKVCSKHISSAFSGAGGTPEEAVRDVWSKLVQTLPEDRALAVKTSAGETKYYRWNGFMWAETEKPQ